MNKILEELLELTTDEEFDISKNAILMGNPTKVRFTRYPEGLFYRAFSKDGFYRFGLITGKRFYTVRLLDKIYPIGREKNERF